VVVNVSDLVDVSLTQTSDIGGMGEEVVEESFDSVSSILRPASMLIQIGQYAPESNFSRAGFERSLLNEHAASRLEFHCRSWIIPIRHNTAASYNFATRQIDRPQTFQPLPPS
jgi:hypothetical protein